MADQVTFQLASSRPRGRPREFDTDAALDAAIGVFSDRGYHGTTITDLAEATGLTAGSLYKAFKDKRGVLLAAFDRYRLIRSHKLRTAVEAGTSGRDKIRAAFAFHAASAHGPSGRRGCLVVSMANELAVSDPLVAERVAAAHAANEGLMRDLVRLGQGDGSLPPGLDPDATALCLLFLLQGMQVIGRTGRTQMQMQAATDAAMRLLD